MVSALISKINLDINKKFLISILSINLIDYLIRILILRKNNKCFNNRAHMYI